MNLPAGSVLRVRERPDVTLRDRALATSAPLGTVLDAEGRIGHILHPCTGLPVSAGWRQTPVTTPSAALPDAWSTASYLMEREAIDVALARLPDVRLVPPQVPSAQALGAVPLPPRVAQLGRGHAT